METRAHHVLIGLFSVIVIGAALLFGLWLAKSGSEGKFNYYDIVFNEAVSGLSQGVFGAVQRDQGRRRGLPPPRSEGPAQGLGTHPRGGQRADQAGHHRQAGAHRDHRHLDHPLQQRHARQPDAGGQGREDPGDRRHALAADPVTEQRRRPDGQHQPAHRALQQPALRGKHSAHQPHPRPSRPGHRRALRRARERQRGDAAVGPGEQAGQRRPGPGQRVDAQRQRPAQRARQGDAGKRQQDHGFAGAHQRHPRPVDQRESPLAGRRHPGTRRLGPAVSELRDTLAALRGISRRLEENPANYLLGREKTKEFTP